MKYYSIHRTERRHRNYISKRRQLLYFVISDIFNRADLYSYYRERSNRALLRFSRILVNRIDLIDLTYHTHTHTHCLSLRRKKPVFINFAPQQYSEYIKYHGTKFSVAFRVQNLLCQHQHINSVENLLVKLAQTDRRSSTRFQTTALFALGYSDSPTIIEDRIVQPGMKNVKDLIRHTSSDHFCEHLANRERSSSA